MKSTKRRTLRRASPKPLLRTSERSSLKTCEAQWWWGYVDRIKPRREAPALEFGTLVHRALELYYCKGKKRGPHPTGTFKQVYDKHYAEIYESGYREEETGDWINMRDLGIAMLDGYYDLYHERDLQYQVISSERTFQVPVHDEHGVHAYTYVGTIDGVWLDRSGTRRKLVLIDHKTAKDIATQYLQLDEQASAYWTWGVDAMQAEGVLPADQEIEWIWFNFLRKGLPDERPWQPSENGMQRVYLNQDGTPSKRQPAPLYHREPVYRNPRTKPMIRARAMVDFKRMRYLRAHPEEVSKSPSRFHCSMCAFKDMCILHEDGADWPSYVSGMMSAWDPYNAHEIEVAEKR